MSKTLETAIQEKEFSERVDYLLSRIKSKYELKPFLRDMLIDSIIYLGKQILKKSRA